MAIVSDAGIPGQRFPTMEDRSEEHTSELQSQSNLVCRLLLEKKKMLVASASLVFTAARRGPVGSARPMTSLPGVGPIPGIELTSRICAAASLALMAHAPPSSV